MKKLKTYMSIVFMVVLLGACVEFGSPRPIQATVPSPVQDGGTDNADFLIWQRTIGMAAGQLARVTVANMSTGRNAGPLRFQCSVFDQNGRLVFQSAGQEVLPGRFGIRTFSKRICRMCLC
jgi:hypothetical protein